MATYCIATSLDHKSLEFCGVCRTSGVSPRTEQAMTASLAILRRSGIENPLPENSAKAPLIRHLYQAVL